MESSAIREASTRSTSWRAGVLALGLAVGLALSGCAAPGGAQNPPDQNGPGQSDPGQSDPGQSGPDDTEAESTASIPEGWPAAIQVVAGPIVEGYNVDDTMFLVTVEVTGDGRAIFDEGVALLEGAGHTLVFLLDDDESSLTGQWMGEGYRVNFDVSHTDGTRYASYTVTSAS